MKRILIIGLPQCGKSTVGGLLAAQLGEQSRACSDVIAERLDQFITTVTGCRGWVDALAEHKKETRDIWIAVGDHICKNNPCGLAGALFDSGVNVVNGIRREVEFRAIVEEYRPLIIWIHRDARPDVTDNSELTPSHADIVIPNNSSPDAAVARIIDYINHN